MAIRTDIGPIAVPDWAKVDARGFVFRKFKGRGGKWNNLILGKLVDPSPNGEKMMLPNDAFVQLEPEYISECTGDPYIYAPDNCAGPYAVTLRLSAQSGLYQSVLRTFGLVTGNVLMDYALMINVIGSYKTYLFESFTDTYLHFSQGGLTGSYLSQLLSDIPDLRVKLLRAEWLEQYKAHHANCKVWLCLDGPTNDCNSLDSALAASTTNNQTTINGSTEHGTITATASCNLIGQIWAFDTATGIPVTWSVNDDSLDDAEAIHEVLTSLTDSGIDVQGFMLSSTVASDEIINLIQESKYQYIIRLNECCSAYAEMMARHARELPRNIMRRVAEGGIYGMLDKVNVFKKSAEPTSTGLLFNLNKATEFVEDFADRVHDEQDRLRRAIDNGDFSVRPSSEFASFISISQSADNPKPVVSIDYDRWQNISDSLGFFAVACSEGISIEELFELSQLQDDFESIASKMKSRLDLNNLRGQSNNVILSKVVVSFIAAVNHQMLSYHCKRLKVSVDSMMEMLEEVAFAKNGKGLIPIFTPDEQVNALFDAIGIIDTDFNDLVNQVSAMRHGERLPDCRTLFSLTKDMILTQVEPIMSLLKPQSPASAPNTNPSIIKRSRGRPKGSKNKKTLERERLAANQAAAQADAPLSAAASGTATSSAAESTAPTTVVKRGPGRPKGSKNKKTLERERLAAEQAAAKADALDAAHA